MTGGPTCVGTLPVVLSHQPVLHPALQPPPHGLLRRHPSTVSTRPLHQPQEFPPHLLPSQPREIDAVLVCKLA